MSRRPLAPPSQPDRPRRAAIYTRKSTTMGLEQEFNSLDAQREACAAYVQRQQGWTLVDEHYDDGGFTGANTDRPSFQRMMADAEAGKFDVVVVYKVDRLSRSLLDFVKVMERLNSVGVSFVSVTQNFTTADAMGRLTMNMLMSFAEFEREMIAERTRDKIAMSRRKGKWTGGPVPFGYSVVNKQLVVNEVEANTVREAFALFLAHRQMAAVARELNERGLLPRGSRGRPSKRGLYWSKDGISRVLRSPLYAGFMMYGDELHPGEQPRLIDDATYHQAQRLLQAAQRGEPRPHSFNPEFVLRGLLRCGQCEGWMTAASTRGGEKRWRYYRCSTRDKFGKKRCSARPLPADALEEFVAERIGAATQDPGFAPCVESILRGRIEERREALLRIRADLPARVASAADASTKLTEELPKFQGRARELIENKLRVETDRLVAAERQLADTERELAGLVAATEHMEWSLAALRDFRRVWKAMTQDNRGRLLRAIVTEVRVDERSADVHIELLHLANPYREVA